MTRDGMIASVSVPRALLRNEVHFRGWENNDCLTGDLILRDGRIVGMRPSVSESTPGGMVLPGLTEPHVHLDKCHTIGRIGAHGGTLMDAIHAQSADKIHWTRDDLRARAGRGMQELQQAGCRHWRSHVDWPHGEDATGTPDAWHVLCELAQDLAPGITAQLAPLVSVTDHATPGVSDAIARQIVGTGSALGCFVYQQPDRAAGIRAAFAAAETHGLPLDFHVDEGLEENLDGLRIIAQTAIDMRSEGPVLCGHACSLINLDGDAWHRCLNLVVEAGLHVVALPSTNLYLQGRRDGTPDRRGITRVKELREAGVVTAIGTDNVRDAFCPLNRHDPRLSLTLAALGVHLDPAYGPHLPMITTDAARAIGLPPTYIDGAAPEDLQIYAVQDTAELLSDTRAPTPLTDLIQGDTA